jgi:hypothetical protein
MDYGPDDPRLVLVYPCKVRPFSLVQNRDIKVNICIHLVPSIKGVELNVNFPLGPVNEQRYKLTPT